MIMKTTIIIAILFSIVQLIRPTFGSIDYQNVVNAQNVTQFTVQEKHFLYLPNQHRKASSSSTPTLKLSLPSKVSFEKVEQLKSGNSTWTLKLNDTSSIDLTVEEVGVNVTEWSLVWHGGGQNLDREVCVHYGFGSWYNTYQSLDHAWPLDPEAHLERMQFGFLHDSLAEYHLKFVSILEYLFLSSDGFALVLDQQAPWFRRIDPNEQKLTTPDPLYCFSVNNTVPYDTTNKDPSYLDLKLHFYSSSNIRTVTDHVVAKSGLIPSPKSIPSEHMFTHPTWSSKATDTIHYQVKEVYSEFGKNITKYGFSKHDIVMDTFFDSSDYQNLSDYLKSSTVDLHKQGFSVGMEIYSFIHQDLSKDHQELFVQLGEKNHLNTFLDYSSPHACKYWTDLIENMKSRDKIDSFRLSEFSLFSWTEVSRFNQSEYQKYPNLYTKKYVDTSFKATANLTTEMAFKNQDLPIFVQMFPIYSNDSLALLNLIPNALSLSIGGYSFLTSFSSFSDRVNPELYIRYVQASALFPGITVAHAPWAFNNETVLNITRKFLKLHEEYAPVLIELAKKRVKDGSPIVRPLWYVAPDEPATYTISDQYMAGEDILVAPILREGQHERAVYLPAGQWIDQHGKTYTGGGAQVKIAIPLDELPIFKRKL